MRQLDDAHPDADRDRDLRTDVNTRFLSSFSGLLDDISASGLETEPYRKKVDGIEASRKISGMCHVIYDRLLSAARQQDIAEIERILKCFLEVPDNLDKTRIIGFRCTNCISMRATRVS
jgi:predicted adenine nucleotide alpha hydrolase (AANH) superfamily ATPase